MTDLTPILSAVRQAATLCRRVQEAQFVSSEKGANDPVTIADYGVQAIICRAIRQHYPNDAIISEEQGSQFISLLADPQRVEIVQLLNDILDTPVTQQQVVDWLDHGRGRDAERTWVIDPVDGTKGFIAMRRYSIAVGVMVNGEPVEGILGSPGHAIGAAMGGLFYTTEGGALAEAIDGGNPTPIRVSDVADLSKVRIVESVVKAHADLERAARIRDMAGITDGSVEQLDSQDKYALVASGEADLYMRLPRAATDKHWIWDHAAGTAIVRAAGGIVTDIDGGKLNFSPEIYLAGNQGVVASNGRIHDRVIRAIQATNATD